MPLIIISGYPCSGKTRRARQLVADFDKRIAESSDARVRRLKIHHIDDHGLGISRDVYANVRAEKDARAAFASAIRRVLGKDSIVIADGMNYIKGFRYQLYCEAKAVPTPSCVLQPAVPPDKCKALNDAIRLENGPTYDPSTFDNLVYRYEEPNGMSRWDAPLFVVPHDDPMPPCDAIWTAMVGKTGDDGAGDSPVVRPNAATVLRPATEQDYLYELDRATAEVVDAVTIWQRDHPGEGGSEVRVIDVKHPVRLPLAPLSLPQLQRLRRQFTAINRLHPQNKKRIRELFVDFLNDAFQN